MTIWALSDLHLSFGVSNKSMEIFGPLWEGYTDKIEKNWRHLIKEEDLVLIPGDISWAMKLEEALVDLKWIHSLPGTKVILKGNHDYWWGSLSKLSQILPESIHLIQNNVYNWNQVSIGGARLWDSLEYRFDSYIQFQKNPKEKKEEEKKEESEKIFERELQRLDLSLKHLNQAAKIKIALTHYPPIGNDLKPSRASLLLEKYQIDCCIFGHLHSINKNEQLFGEARGIRYILSSCDYLDFKPIKIL